MMAASSSSSNLSDHLVQDDLVPWPASSSSSLPFAPAPHHSAIIGGNHGQQWCQHPITLNCADRYHYEELEVLLSAQGGHHHSHSSHPSPVIPPLSSLLMMQNLGFQWSNCGSFLDTSSSMPPMNVQQHDGHNKIKEEDTLMNSSRSSCASTAIAACHDDIVLDGGGGGSLHAMAAVAADLDGATVLPSVNNSRTTTTTHQIRPFPAAPPPLPGDAFEILASSRLCKTLLLSQASSVLLHNGTMPLLRSEHVPYGPPPAAAHPHGPSIDNYKQMGAAGGGRHWSAEHDAACQSRAAAAARPVPSQAPSSKKPRVEQRSSSPSFKVRKEKLGDRIAALQQLVSPFGKTDTASVLMEAIGYIKFLQDQVETLSRPYLKSSRSKKPKPTQRGCSNANAAGEQEETRLDLRSRGLCLVPLSCTSYVTNENGVWVPPNFRGN
ncbi:transcription factor bHLH110-like [Miscanthus floridulus]|uniref:transcription factor bHLH110-like n=1 Tax=Miscanthus floridulus TaxID=154761 RepID=UPI0034577E05